MVTFWRTGCAPGCAPFGTPAFPTGPAFEPPRGLAPVDSRAGATSTRGAPGFVPSSEATKHPVNTAHPKTNVPTFVRRQPCFFIVKLPKKRPPCEARCGAFFACSSRPMGLAIASRAFLFLAASRSFRALGGYRSTFDAMLPSTAAPRPRDVAFARPTARHESPHRRARAMPHLPRK